MSSNINSVLDFINITYTSYVGTVLKDSNFFVLIHTFFESTFINLVFLVPELCLKYTAKAALVVALKFILIIALFVFIRGGIPRYRYDFLTKIG